MTRRMTFHTGEFARITGVNKRTLHYYDQQGIFSPDSIEPNGYRAYSSRQFYPFYMIRMFRDMGLELSEIKEYMENRSPERFAALLAGQEEWLDQEMAKLRRMKQIVANQRHILKKAQEVQLDRVDIIELPEQRLLVSENLRPLHLKEDWESIEEKLAAHMRLALESEALTSCSFGAMVAREDYLRPGFEQVISYFYVSTEKKWRQLPKEQRRIRPAGPYAVTYFSGDYMNTASAYARLRDYLQEHKLKPAGPSYEESLLEDMSTANAEEFITRVAVPVDIS